MRLAEPVWTTAYALVEHQATITVVVTRRALAHRFARAQSHEVMKALYHSELDFGRALEPSAFVRQTFAFDW